VIDVARTILVTGATGFIGGRLVERLSLERGARVRALVRNFGQATRIARFPVEMLGGELADVAAVDRVVANCDLVFHLAYDPTSPQRNLEGIRNLAEACLRHRVRRLVHVSTLAVYDFGPEADVTEESPPHPPGWRYAQVKRAVEEEVLRFAAERGLPAVVIQPTVVYGPYSTAWTMEPAQQLLSNTVVLPASPGVCNLVYVDDVVNALLLAAERDDAAGERFLISGGDAVSWSDLYRAYEEVLGVRALRLMPEEDILKASRSISPMLKQLFTEPKRAILKWPALHGFLQSLYLFLPEGTQRLALRAYFYKKAGAPRGLYLPDREHMALYTSRGRVRTHKAERILGYTPSYSFSDGMKMTAAYLRWAFPQYAAS
jgi:nucleoside-diphosphate-sugar epimerase